MNICERVEVEYKKKKKISPLFPSTFWIVSVCQWKYRKKKEKRRKEKKIRIEHKPNWTLLTLGIM